MNIIFRSPGELIASMRRDLSRPHAFAAERVGFITVRATAANDTLMLLAQDYHGVADDDYVPDRSVGAMIGQEALRKALEIALLNNVGVFHVHMHEFPGRLWFSRIDLHEQLRFVPDFFKVRRKMPHGALVLSPRAAAGRVWLSPERAERIAEFNIVGKRLHVFHSAEDGSVDFYG
ncbi:MAG: hypothetical protein EPO20_20330 [Betaproteobacteria bacterium]|nr:MAG: hypothetical protein EPO20_20330 [Betaproteobacteria bacterium]